MVARYKLIIITLFTVLFCQCLPSATFAGQVRILDDAPSVYVVKKGDTLWEIAEKYLHEPWLWPEIWASNPDIRNPHLIYPGDQIVMGKDANGNTVLSLRRKEHRTYWQNGERVVKLSPTIRRYPADGAIPTVPINIIKPFFNRSRVISNDMAEQCPKIVALDEDHLVVGMGDRIYAKDLLQGGHSEVYSIFRVEKDYVHPTNNEYLGTEGLDLGQATLEKYGNPASLIIRKSNSEIRVGDQLVEPQNLELDAYFTPKSPQGLPEGLIISVFGGLSQIGQYQVVVITGGYDQFRESGDVLSVYQSQKDIPSRIKHKTKIPDDYPSLKVGKLVVFRVFDKVSYALVMKANRPIYMLDNVGHP